MKNTPASAREPHELTSELMTTFRPTVRMSASVVCKGWGVRECKRAASVCVCVRAHTGQLLDGEHGLQEVEDTEDRRSVVAVIQLADHSHHLRVCACMCCARRVCVCNVRKPP